MRIPLWLKVAWTVWVLCWIPIYWRQYGAQNFLYFCDLGNLIIAVALWTESALLFSSQAVSLLVFQTLYCIDLAGALMSGRHVIGGTEYMFDPGLSLYVRLLSLFHLATPPMLLWAIWRLGFDPRGWELQTLICWVVVTINHFWRPEMDVNWALGLFFREQRVLPGWLYLLGYLVVVPAVVYWPTHRVLLWWARRIGSQVASSKKIEPSRTQRASLRTEHAGKEFNRKERKEEPRKDAKQS